MAGQTSIVLVNVSTYAFVFFIGIRIGVATNTSELGIITRIGVAFRALVPFAFMRTTINRKILIVMIKSGGHPIALPMATGTIRGKLRRNVIRIAGLVEVG